jgi:hypothetical protein
MGGQEFSSLPTPTHRDYKDNQVQPAKHRPNDKDTLNRAIAFLPTPAVNDMGAGKDPQTWNEWAARQKAADGRPAPHGKSLEQEALTMLPTPRATMHKNSTGQDRGMGSLDDWNIEVVAVRIGANTQQPYIAGSQSSDDLHRNRLFTELDATDSTPDSLSG